MVNSLAFFCVFSLGECPIGLIGWGVCRPSQAPQIQPGKSDRNHQLHSWSHVFPLEGLIPDAKQSHQLSISHAWPTAPANKNQLYPTPQPPASPQPQPPSRTSVQQRTGSDVNFSWRKQLLMGQWWLGIKWFYPSGGFLKILWTPNHQLFVGFFSIPNHPFIGIAPPQMALDIAVRRGLFFPKANPPTYGTFWGRWLFLFDSFSKFAGIP